MDTTIDTPPDSSVRTLTPSMRLPQNDATCFRSLRGCILPEGEAGKRAVRRLPDWQFIADESEEGTEATLPGTSANWTDLTLPHVFRLSGLPEKSAGFYRRTLDITSNDAGSCFYLLLEGAGSVAEVFVNGQPIGKHRGAYTAAAFDLTAALKPDEPNELIVRVSNRDEEAANCLSQSILYYTNGGMYRPAWLIQMHGVHIFPDTGSTGVYLTPRNITDKHADLEITTHLRNALEQQVAVTVRHTVFDPDGKQVATTEQAATLSAGQIAEVRTQSPIPNPQLWDIHRPNLYRVVTQLLRDGEVIDAIAERTGIRTIAMQDGDFILNGKKLLVRGVCKHHQDEHRWNAQTDALLKWEMDGMVALGCNGIRLAHYPHRRYEYEMADEAGVVVWAENGFAGQKWDQGVKRETTPNVDGERITREMVRQNWNHPSIVFWSSGNETYQEVASRYADVIREEDDTRLVTYASAGEKPANVDFVAGNTYQGWYVAHFSDFSNLPENAYISETGGGVWPSHHIPYDKVKTVRDVWQVDHYEPQEYGELFAEYRFQTIFRNNPDGHKMFLWWNYREFYDRKFKHNRNTKGILTLAGMPKDYYYLYQSFLRPDHPVLHLTGRHHFLRRFDPANGIKTYANADSVELFINGQSQGVKQNGAYRQPDTLLEKDGHNIPVKGITIDNVFFWNAPLAPGRNVVEVSDSHGLTASMVIYQTAPDGSVPTTDDGPITDLNSSNPDNPAVYIDRPIEAQAPFYWPTDGSADNTFDALPDKLQSARWIATKRLSDPANQTALSFTAARPLEVFIMHATGTFPAHTLDHPDPDMMQAADSLKANLLAAGFQDTHTPGTWRRHNLWLADSALLKRTANPGDTVNISAHTLDYATLIKPL